MTDLLITVAGFMVIYTTLAIIEVKLMLKYIRKGPEEEESADDPARLDERFHRPSPGRRNKETTPCCSTMTFCG